MSKQARGETTAAKVLDAALALAAERGLAALTVQDLSARSGVSMGSLYHHFGSRDGVVFALYRRSLEKMLEAITAEVLPCATPREGVMALVAAYLRWVKRHRSEARVIFGIAEAELSTPHRKELAALGARVVQPLAGWLAPHVAAGTVIPLPPGLLEVMLIGPAAEASRRLLNGGTSYSFSDALAALPEAVWNSVARKHDRNHPAANANSKAASAR